MLRCWLLIFLCKYLLETEISILNAYLRVLASAFEKIQFIYFIKPTNSLVSSMLEDS